MGDRLRRFGPAVIAATLLVVIVAGLASGSPSGDRTQRLAAELRCPVCQSESVADSTSITAARMRAQIDQFVAAGQSDEQIFAYYEERYGRWVRLAPPLAADTVLLWSSPLVVLLLAVAIAVRRRRRTTPVEPISPADRERLRSEVERARHDEAR